MFWSQKAQISTPRKTAGRDRWRCDHLQLRHDGCNESLTKGEAEMTPYWRCQVGWPLSHISSSSPMLCQAYSIFPSLRLLRIYVGVYSISAKALYSESLAIIHLITGSVRRTFIANLLSSYFISCSTYSWVFEAVWRFPSNLWDLYRIVFHENWWIVIERISRFFNKSDYVITKIS